MVTGCSESMVTGCSESGEVYVDLACVTGCSESGEVYVDLACVVNLVWLVWEHQSSVAGVVTPEFCCWCSNTRVMLLV